MVQTFALEHIPSDRPVHVGLFRHVRNSASLKQQLLAGNPEYEYAFIDASVIVSTVHALSAVYRALHDALQGRLKTRNVHSEIVFALSPSYNIAESFRRYGVGEATSSLLAIKVSTDASITHDSVEKHLSEIVEGEAVEFTDDNLSSMTDVETVRKYYKLKLSGGKKVGTASAKAVNGVSDSDVRETKDLEAAILGAMALRGAG
ncbi:MAG: 5'-flap endonuclease [Chaenotheca gracillima]|nr:MAG: 5'-flap endonuclease [Chaenotheca gracillima]